jgi:2-dehydropantoate 2-reductase
VAAGKASEIDGLIYEVVRMGEKYGVSLPLYEKISAELRKKIQ